MGSTGLVVGVLLVGVSCVGAAADSAVLVGLRPKP
jgi:hypothetical protein